MKIAVIDIGGTSIKSGIWENDRIMEVRETKTMAEEGGAAVIQRSVEVLKGYHDFDAIGISTAGQVDSRQGVILYANQNIPGYTGMKVRERFEREFRVPAAVQNDVNCAAIGEAYYGAGTDSNDFLCITYGTGVGGAMILNGKIYTGSSYSAGEFGAIVTHPEDRKADGDPFSGCYERYASTAALVKRVSRQYPDLCSGRAIFEELGNAEVRELVDVWINEVLYGLTTLIHIFNPSLVILGGGVMEQPYILNEIKRRLYGGLMESFHHVNIVSAKLGNTAGLLGASQEALELYHREKMSLYK